MNMRLKNIMHLVTILALLAGSSFSADTQQEIYKVNLEDGLVLYPVQSVEPVNKMAVVVHGFNVRPELMEPAIKYLIKNGIETILVSLSGHRADTTMSFEAWKKDVALGINKAESIANGKEIILLGHSLGGALVSLEAANGETKHHVHKMVLLAPANGLKPLYKVLNLQIKPCKNTEFVAMAKPIIGFAMIFGMNPLNNSGKMICGTNAYKDTLTLQAFEALVAASDLSSSDEFKQALNIKTLVVVDENDGLVDSKKIESIFGDHSTCKVVVLNNTKSPILAHTFQNEELLEKAMQKIIPFILGKDS